MRKVREVLRLKYAVGLSYREISEITGICRTAVWQYIRRAEVTGITWPVPEELDDAGLERQLYPLPNSPAVGGPTIDWVQVQEELKRRGVTLMLLSAGIPRTPSARLRLQPVLRSVQSMAASHIGDDAADARARREAVR